jgi:hypothetical protein
MAMPRHVRLVRVVIVLLFAVGVSVGLSAADEGNSCVVNCGGGCKIVAVNCPSCTGNQSACEIYWTDTGCAEGFMCTPECPDCYTWAN